MNQIKMLLQIASAEIGTKEDPPNSNNVKYNTWYYGRPVNGEKYSWCAVFVTWCFEHAGLSELFFGSRQQAIAGNSAHTPNVVKRASGLGQWITSGYKPGDIVLYDWDKNGSPNHVGIIESVSADGCILTVIEGNTGATNASDGGAVCRCIRNVVPSVMGVFRPKYNIDEEEEMKRYKTIEEIRNDTELAASLRNAYADALGGMLKRGIAIGRAAENLDLTEDMIRSLIYADRIIGAGKQ